MDNIADATVVNRRQFILVNVSALGKVGTRLDVSQ
jgi:hypothetical protein